MKTIRTILSASLFLLAPIACVMESDDPEAVGESGYEVVDGGRADARCVDRSMRRDDEGRQACRAVEARRADDDGRCDCNAPGRRDLDDEERRFVRDAVERDARTRGRDLTCACEVRQLELDNARVCEEERADDASTELRNDRGERIDGWCGDVRRGVDDELDRCDADGRAGIRLIGEARVRDDAELLMRCD